MGQDQDEVVLHAGERQGEEAGGEADDEVNWDRPRGGETSRKQGAQDGSQLLKLSENQGKVDMGPNWVSTTLTKHSLRFQVDIS